MRHEPVSPPETVRLSNILTFFVPLGLAASLITLSHVIINSVLSRAAQPELVIAAYQIALSIFTITERPAFLLRQTTSALSGDRVSFRAMRKLTMLLIGFTLLFGFLIGFTPAGEWLFRLVFNTNDATTPAVVNTYRVVMFVTVFSAMRCLYQGIIIRNMQTKWLTIGMGVRLSVMYGIGLAFMAHPERIDETTGAWLFLIGMAVEALVSLIEGRKIYRSMPERAKDGSVRSVREVLPFYKPLLYSSFIAVIVSPSINAVLGKTDQLEVSIASYAIALSVINLVNSFFTYIHQIVLNFHQKDARVVLRFTALAGMIPGLLVLLLSYTPLGHWFVGSVMGAQGELLAGSLSVLRVMAIVSFAFPWVDYCNGLCMLNKRTKFMLWSQTSNVGMTLLALFVLIFAAPHWNGVVGGVAASCGIIAELIIVSTLLRRSLAAGTANAAQASNESLRG